MIGCQIDAARVVRVQRSSVHNQVLEYVELLLLVRSQGRAVYPVCLVQIYELLLLLRS